MDTNPAKLLLKCKTKATKAEKSKRVWDLKLQGYSFTEISKLTGLTYRTIVKYMNEHLAVVQAETTKVAAEYRTIQLARLDGVLVKLRDKVDIGDDKAINTYIKAVRQQSELMGLIGPSTAIQVNVGQEEEDKGWGLNIVEIETSATVVEDVEESMEDKNDE